LVSGPAPSRTLASMGRGTRTRPWTRAGARLGAVLVAVLAVGGCSVLKGSDASPGSTTSTTYVLNPIDYSPGDCVFWDQRSAEGLRNARVVPCTENHIVQILGSTEVRNGSGVYPGRGALVDLTAATCAAKQKAFLGAPLLRGGRFSPYDLSVTVQGWDQGDRTYWCGIAELDQYSPASQTARVVHTDARGQGKHQLVEVPVGTCSRGYPQLQDHPLLALYVSCDRLHVWEATGHVAFGADETYPDGDHFHQVTTDGCQALFDAKVRAGIAGLIPSNMGISRLQWDAGDRTVTCIATMSGSVPYRGSVLK